jgi:tetratricopeptide (TPR) repeat protein
MDAVIRRSKMAIAEPRIRTAARMRDSAETPWQTFTLWFKKWSDVVTALAVLLAIILGGLIAVMNQIPEAQRYAGILWSLAYLAVGGMVGFLFGIPRVLQNDNPPPSNGNNSTATDPSAPTNSSSSSQPSGQNGTHPAYTQRVNTNLEQISDWLTKILVGVGLIELKELGHAVPNAARYIGQGIGPQHEEFAAAMIVYFSVAGFLNGYLLTRLWLAGAFSRADMGAIGMSRDQALRQADRDIPSPRLVAGPNDNPVVTPPDTSSQGRRAAKDVLTLRLSNLSTPEEIAVWAKTQLNQRNYEEAVNGYSKAVSLDPDDINLRMEYAAALHYAGRPKEKVLEQLLEAYRLMRSRSNVDERLKDYIYQNLIWQSLYLNPPQGFSDAIKYGEEYIRELGGRPIDGATAVNLSAAYGQKYKWLEEHGASKDELNQARDATLKYAKSAIAADERWKERLRQLLVKNDPNKNPADDDLEVFEQDPEFRALVGLA